MSAALVERPTIAALIVAERAAYSRLDRAWRATDSVALGREPTEQEQDECDAANDAQGVAFEAVIETSPTTPEELIAIIDLFAEREMEVVSSPVDGYLTTVFDNVKAFLRRPPPRPAKLVVPDTSAAAQRADRAERQVRDLDADNRRLRARAEAAETRLASMGGRP